MNTEVYRSIVQLYNHAKVVKYYFDNFRNKITSPAFYCQVLEGEIPFAITVNSDMTVSCNEHDYDYSCVLGNLKENTLQEIVNGPIIDTFRQQLAESVFPSRMCAYCHYRKPIPKSAWHPRERFEIRTLRIEPSRLCNLRCLSCKNQNIPPEAKKAVLSNEDMEIICKNINDNNIPALVITALGEPFISDNCYDQMAIIRKNTRNVEISSSTNGMLLNNEKKVEAALMMDHLYFSIFGPNNKVYTIYHKNGIFDVAYANMANLVQVRNQRKLKRPIIEWKYVLFCWNDRKKYINQALRLAEEAGVDCLALYPTAHPIICASLRYRLNPYYKRLGTASHYGRRIFFAENTEDYDILTKLTPKMM